MKTRAFRLGTTSFIYPDHIIPNVRKVGGIFDEIELLVFESLPEAVVPSKADVRALAGLGRDLNLMYNVHLPVDVSLTDPSANSRQQAADILARVVERFSPLSPTTFTLHLDMARDLSGSRETAAWQERAADGLARMIPRLNDPTLISVETLWYDPAALAPLVREFGLSVCADLGHHFKYGYDPETTATLFGDAISTVHLHGVDLTGETPKDHTGLDKMSQAHWDQAVSFLDGFVGTVSLEVFNYANLEACLKRLADEFTDIPELKPAG